MQNTQCDSLYVRMVNEQGIGYFLCVCVKNMKRSIAIYRAHANQSINQKRIRVTKVTNVTARNAKTRLYCNKVALSANHSMDWLACENS